MSALLSGVLIGQHKLIHDRHTGRFELYDLARDPLEQHDLADREPELRADLQRELDAMATAIRPRRDRPSESRGLGHDERKMLRELGYEAD